jgi:hypothetical protein
MGTNRCSMKELAIAQRLPAAILLRRALRSPGVREAVSVQVRLNENGTLWSRCITVIPPALRGLSREICEECVHLANHLALIRFEDEMVGMVKPDDPGLWNGGLKGVSLSRRSFCLAL